MSSKVETSLDIRSGRKNLRFLDFARNDKSVKPTQQLFATLRVYHDDTPYSAAMNMAIDEALLECATEPIIRFYRWKSPALSFGYFGRFIHVASYRAKRDLVRRWTGGGIVLHGTDLTYSIVIPASDPAFPASSMSIYEKIHHALVEALKENGQPAVVASGADRGGVTRVNDPGCNCFENPVHSDVMINGRKIAGAAQRRTRRGLLQQGSIQGIDVANRLAERFAWVLSAKCCARKIGNRVSNRARELAEQKYGTESWLRKR